MIKNNTSKVGKKRGRKLGESENRQAVAAAVVIYCFE